MNLDEHIVYVLPVEETREYLEEKYPDDTDKSEDFVLYLDEEMPEEECKEILERAKYDENANVFTLRQFQSEFNFAMDDGIASPKYLIKVF